ncbi:MAG: DUF1080 domain-containing protein [Rikenellaceae bacterium]
MNVNRGLKTLIIFTFFSVNFAFAQQKEYPIAPKMSAEMTEVWLPQPEIVTTDDFDNKMVKAPSDAIILYDGTSTNEWKKAKKDEKIEWISEDGVLTILPKSGSIKTLREFGDCQLHIEWSVPEDTQGEGQDRGNSGVLMQERYEIQILDNYNNETYANGQAGSIYKQTAPLVNAMQKPGKWNVYDIIYTAPIFKDGKMVVNPNVTVIHNGVVIQNNTDILGTTQYIGLPQIEEHGRASILLQDHRNPVMFRNIWIREL